MQIFLQFTFLFFLGAIAGWVLELFFRRFKKENIDRKWVNPGFLNGPYLPIYGFGVCTLYGISALIDRLPIGTMGGVARIAAIFVLSGVGMTNDSALMAYSLILSSLLSQLINTWPNRKLLDYRYLEQLKDILPSILLAIFMGCCMWLVNLAHLPDIVTLVIQILIGASVYLGGSALLKLDTFEYLWNVVKPKIQRKPWADNEE